MTTLLTWKNWVWLLIVSPFPTIQKNKSFLERRICLLPWNSCFNWAETRLAHCIYMMCGNLQLNSTRTLDTEQITTGGKLHSQKPTILDSIQIYIDLSLTKQINLLLYTRELPGLSCEYFNRTFTLNYIDILK